VTFRRFIAGLGRTLIGTGVLILLFVAYELWGTGLFEHRTQARLKKAAPPPPECSAEGSTITNPTPPATPEGEAVARIKICRIGVEKAVVNGVGDEDLKKGPGHYPDTPLPGTAGNAAIAGHRTTYGAPFFRLDEVENGDPIMVSTAQGQFRYEVTEKTVVTPTHVEVLDNTPDNRLTLTTCEPRFSAAKRLIVVAKLIGTAAPAPPPPKTAPKSLAGESGNLSGKRHNAGPAVEWGSITAAIALFAWFAGRLWRKWPSYLIATPIFLVALFIFFENFSVLLPANI
jgi:sortase A